VLNLNNGETGFRQSHCRCSKLDESPPM
jgi:hypothetical protein